ncbi:MAG: sulfatase-like hydrolase/transferase [Actinomycetota bacterium]|nr:sulfatase-like hydrolase/transferase [Actinomycetota bacterium]
MDRRTLLKALGLSTVAAGLPAPAVGDVAARPNVLWFRSEDNGAEFIGAYGSPLANTPTIDRLAREGVRFTSFFSTSPVCAPSKLATLTGLYEASLGPGQHMRANAVTPGFVRGFAAYLRDAGYWCTEQGLPSANPDHNTDLADTGYDDTSGDWSKRPPGRPFFALLGSMTTHETSSILATRGATDPAQVRLPAYHPDTPVMRRDRAHYMDQVAKMDAELARVLARLEADGLADDTIVVYSSDHGGVLPRSKRYCYDSGLRAPLVMRFPPRWAHLAPAAPGETYDAPASSVDAGPTILGLAGVDAPSHFHGQAFAGPSTQPRTYAFGGRNRMDEQLDFVRTVRDQRFRYIRNYMPHLTYAQHNQFMWLQAGVREWEALYLAGKLNEVQSRFWRTKPAEELYDLESDPDETVNLIDRPRHFSKVKAMRRALDEHMLRINDNGFIPEGMAAEGWDASRRPGAYPLARVMELAGAAIRRDPANVPMLGAALQDPNEIVRYWAAMGCSMLGPSAAPANDVLLSAATADVSPWVRAQAADALLATGRATRAVAVLNGLVGNPGNPVPVRLQAVWSLARAKQEALAAVPVLTLLSLDLGNLGNAARYALRQVTGTYVPAP